MTRTPDEVMVDYGHGRSDFDPYYEMSILIPEIVRLRARAEAAEASKEDGWVQYRACHVLHLRDLEIRENAEWRAELAEAALERVRLVQPSNAPGNAWNPIYAQGYDKALSRVRAVLGEELSTETRVDLELPADAPNPVGRPLVSDIETRLPSELFDQDFNDGPESTPYERSLAPIPDQSERTFR